MASNAQVSVTDAPTILYQSNGPQVETVMLDNTGSATITIGGKGVTSGLGPQLPQSAVAVTFQINEDTLYAIAPSGQSATVEVASWLSGPNT